MLFFILNNINIQFVKKELIWRFYTAAETLPITKQVKHIDKKKFANIALEKESKTFVVYVAVLEALIIGMTIYLFRTALITNGDSMQVATLKQNKALIKVSTKYSDFADAFLKEKVLMLSEQIELNQYAIKLERDNQLLYWPIYSLGLMKLKTLKTYTETHLKTRFSQSSKSSAGAPILFNKKPDNSFWLCINY